MSDFETWLQERLNAHGASPRLIEDGDWGRRSIRALKEFQRRRRLKVTGTATTKTVEALQRPAKTESRRPSRDLIPDERMPPWMAEMHRRKGLHEVRDNAALAEFMRRWGRYLGNPADLPWCGDAVESVIAKTLPDEPLPGNPFWAQAWRDFGVDAGGYAIGAIGVIRWSARAGHVGIIAGVSRGRVHLLGGNQTNAITIASFPESKFIAARWPSTFPFKVYAPLVASAPAVDFAGTR